MPFDPENPTFYGESMPVDRAIDITGDAISSAPVDYPASVVSYYWTESEDGLVSAAAVAGDSFIAGFYPDYYYLEADSVAECFVVVELEEGTSAQIRLRAGSDPDWELTNPALATEDLGTHTVTGKQRLVLPTSIITGSMVYESEVEPLVYLEVLSGTAMVRQIRLRVWPPGGPSGAWVVDPNSYDMPADYPRAWRGGTGFVMNNADQGATAEPPELALGKIGPFGSDYTDGPGIHGGWDDYGSGDNAPFVEMVNNMATRTSGIYFKYFISGGPWNSTTTSVESAHSYHWTLQQIGEPSHDWNAYHYFTGLLIELPEGTTTGWPGGFSYGDPDRVNWERSDTFRDPETKGDVKLVFAGWNDAATMSSDQEGRAGLWIGAVERPTFIQQINGVSGGSLYTMVETEEHYTPGPSMGVGIVGPIATGTSMPIPDSPAFWVTAIPGVLYDPPANYSEFEWDSTVGVGSFTQQYGAAGRFLDLRGYRTVPAGMEYFDPSLPWVDPDVTEPPDFEAGYPDGYSASVADAGEYIYTGEVDSSTPTPHLWFVFRTYAFGGDHILVYGTGLGVPQSEYDGRMFIDWGPNYATTDVEPTVVGWTESTASDQAYTGEGQIFPGTDAAPPVVDAEVQVVELIVPPEIVGDAAYEEYIYAVTIGGTSNRLTLMVYPISPHGMMSTAPANRVRTAVRVSADLGEPMMMMFAIGGDLGSDPNKLGQLYAHYTSEPYIISGNRPERVPLFSALGYSEMTLAGEEGTSGADDPVDVALEMQLRWRPLESEIEPREDLGTGASVWTPTTTSTQGWKFLNDSAPYIDPENTYDSRYGALTRPAMVHPGDAWMELVNAVPSGPTFTLIFVAHLHANTNDRSILLSSYPTGAPDPDAYPLELALVGDELVLTIGTAISRIRLTSGYIGERPVIIGIRTDGTSGGLAAIAGTNFNRDFTHPKLDTTGLKLYMGRSNDPDNLRMPRMDVLDMGFSDYKFTYTTMWRQMNFLDGAYGVSQ